MSENSSGAIHANPREYYEERVRNLDGLPSLPTIATELLNVLHSEDASVQQIGRLIKRDPTLSLKVLRVANSARYGFLSRVADIDLAITLLGFRDVIQLAVGFSVANLFFRTIDKRSDLDWSRFWQHSAATAHMATLFWTKLKLKLPWNPFTAGLVHDVGKIALYTIAPEEYESVFNSAIQLEIPIREVEAERLGVTHEEAGAWLAESWKLPDSIILPIRYHHAPDDLDDARYQLTAAVIALSNVVTSLRAFDFGNPFLRLSLPQNPAWGILVRANPELRGFDFEQFMIAIADEIEAIEEMTRMVLN